MKQQLLQRLCCPKCKGDLSQSVFERSESGDMRNGILECFPCALRYPVANGIPVFLLFRTSFHDEFEKQYGSQLAANVANTWPSALPGPGEATVQETFTEEWDPIATGDDSLTFTYTTEDLVALNRSVWLKWLGNSAERVRSTLVVGCGGGKEILALSQVLGDSEVFGIDINLAVLRSGPRLLSNERVHVVLCSLFQMPFREGSFDLVYSQGVIHHNVSTQAAFKSIARFVSKGGHLFVWVYGLDDHLAIKGYLGLLARSRRWIEAVLRPVISRLPAAPRSVVFFILGVVLHPIVLLRIRHRKEWALRNTIHVLRDWLSPRYAHVHGYNEVIEWFEAEGYEVVDVQSSGAYRKLFNRRLWGVGMTGRRVK